MIKWHTKKIEEIFAEVSSSESGLTSKEVEVRKEKFGRNVLKEPKRTSILTIFFRQFKSPVIYVLLVATAIVVAMGDYEDGIVIFAVLFLNALIGTMQEGKAENTLNALRTLVTTEATVLRDGIERLIPDSEIVPGDILILREGDKIPADARVFQFNDLNVDESALTGESETVIKTADAIDNEEASPADQKNMVFKGTYVVGGEAKAVVTTTGLLTIIGSISVKLESLETDVPLKKQIAHLSSQIIVAVLVISALIFVAGIVKGFGVREMFSSVVAICVSAIPEGLPVVVTVILATGMFRMSKKNALVKKLQAVEALGQANIVAVDKTGTITLNQMMVKNIFTSSTTFEVEGSGYAPEGSIKSNGSPIEPLNNENIVLLGRTMALSVHASVAYAEDTKEWKRLSGDPTEAALLVLSHKIGFHTDTLEKEYKKIFEIPFSSDIKYRAVIHEHHDKNRLTVIGAPEVLVEYCTKIIKDGRETDITIGDQAEIHAAMESFFKQGLRVIAITTRSHFHKEIPVNDLPELSFLGLVAMSDTIRTEIYDVVQAARGAGVRTVMITGDHAVTAQAIAEKAGIYKAGDTVLTADDLHRLSDNDLQTVLPSVSVFARVTPDEKLKIIEAYRSSGNIIAMTGDGVNDALSLAAADLGVAMGKTGTEVAKEAADIILLDDNFTSIIAAIDEGRHIYNTIKKVILYLFSTSIVEICVIAIAIVAGYPLPLSPSQIIWLNFVTDGFLVVALALEPKERSALTAPLATKKLIDRAMIIRIAILGGAMTVGALALFHVYLASSGFAVATTVVVTALAVSQWFNIWNVRSETQSIFNKQILKNKYLNIAIVIVFIAQLLSIYNPFFQRILNTTPIDLKTWLVIIAVSFSVILVDEIQKLVNRRIKT